MSPAVAIVAVSVLNPMGGLCVAALRAYGFPCMHKESSVVPERSETTKVWKILVHVHFPIIV